MSETENLTETLSALLEPNSLPSRSGTQPVSSFGGSSILGRHSDE